MARNGICCATRTANRTLEQQLSHLYQWNTSNLPVLLIHSATQCQVHRLCIRLASWPRSHPPWPWPWPWQHDADPRSLAPKWWLRWSRESEAIVKLKRWEHVDGEKSISIVEYMPCKMNTKYRLKRKKCQKPVNYVRYSWNFIKYEHFNPSIISKAESILIQG